MHIIGIGVDIVDLQRIRSVRFFDRFSEYVCTEEERIAVAKSRNQYQCVAKYLAIKESVIKAYPHALTYHDVVLTKTAKGVTADCRHPQSAVYDVLVSVAHELSYVVSNAIVVKRGEQD